MTDDETTFLVGFKKPSGYGTTPTSIQRRKPGYSRVIKHSVSPGDTLQGLALRYGSSMVEIKRLNKLWSAESIYLRNILDIPIWDPDPETPSTSKQSDFVLSENSVSAEASSSSAAGLKSANSIADDDSATDVNFDRGATANLREPSKSKDSIFSMSSDDVSIHDFLSRIDTTTKQISKNVRKIKKHSSIDDCENSSISSPTSYSYTSPGSFLDESVSVTALNHKSESPKDSSLQKSNGHSPFSFRSSRKPRATPDKTLRVEEEHHELRPL